MSGESGALRRAPSGSGGSEPREFYASHQCRNFVTAGIPPGAQHACGPQGSRRLCDLLLQGTLRLEPWSVDHTAKRSACRAQPPSMILTDAERAPESHAWMDMRGLGIPGQSRRQRATSA